MVNSRNIFKTWNGPVTNVRFIWWFYTIAISIPFWNSQNANSFSDWSKMCVVRVHKYNLFIVFGRTLWYAVKVINWKSIHFNAQNILGISPTHFVEVIECNEWKIVEQCNVFIVFTLFHRYWHIQMASVYRCLFQFPVELVQTEA